MNIFISPNILSADCKLSKDLRQIFRIDLYFLIKLVIPGGLATEINIKLNIC